VVRHERARVSTTRDRVQHWRFHFEEATTQHEITDFSDSAGANQKTITTFFVHDQVNIALTIDHFRIL